MEVMQQNVCVKLGKEPEDLEEIRDGFIKKNPWGVIYKVYEELYVVSSRLALLQINNLH